MYGLNTPQRSICSGNTQKSNLWQFFLQISIKQDSTRENLKDNIIAKATFKLS